MFEIAPDEFALNFFKEEGITRQPCPRCKSWFWAKPGRETCGEVPCSPYTFLDNSPMKRNCTLHEMRQLFLEYFKERDHTIILPYPIVARWRDDVYLVGASIMDFQPYVIEGTVPPPANPLVVSQPSVRFTDIENVGPTAGRHLTIFEMGGAHAFNYPDHEVYWKEDCVRYHHKLLTEVLGVPSEMISYKEHFWSGGGNAGPDLEGIVAGLEISTLVFMRYKVEDETLVPMKIRTVDTGYGIERWTWMSQGSPTGFHAIYGSLLDTLFDLTGVEDNTELSRMLSLAAGANDVTTKAGREASYGWIAEKTGLEISKVREKITSLEAVLALADHTKTASFLLADGVVPSNIGGGYLARLIIRRAARLARQFGIENKLEEIVEMQVKHWGTTFPAVREMRGEILDALRVELRKYQETIAKGSEMVIRLSKELSSMGEHKIPLGPLIQLYDSHGLSPEIVKEVAEKAGVEVQVPDNFLTLVAERHLKPAQKTRAENADRLAGLVKGLMPTRTLYYEDSYQTSFTAKAIAKVGDNGLVLDQTCFYPEGGGQPADHGSIRIGERTFRIVDVQKSNSVIVHFLDEPVPEGIKDQPVEGLIDWSRRQNLMRHHTATHVLLGSARRVLGEHVWQAGAQKEVEHSRLDVTHYSEITSKEREKIEQTANQVVLRNLPVQATWMAREKAEAKYGFRLYQGGPVPGSKIRVVTIEGWDAEACGGTHCKTTGELGVLRIEKVERLQDGIERFTFTAGEPALKNIHRDSSLLSETSQILGISPDNVPETVKKLLKEKEDLERELKRFREKQADSRINRLAKKAESIGTVRLVVAKIPKRKDTDLVAVANQLKESDPNMVVVLFEVSKRVQVVAAAGEEAVKAGANAGQVVTEVGKIIGGGGGGRPFFATGGGTRKEDVGKALDRAREVVKSQVESGGRGEAQSQKVEPTRAD